MSMPSFKTLLTAICMMLIFAPVSVQAAISGLNMSRGVSKISEEAYKLHMILLWICVAIAVVVFGAMFYSISRHRKSQGVTSGNFHHSTQTELLWAAVPCVIVVTMALPATKAMVRMEEKSRADLTIKITGYQWKWRYEYQDSGVSFYSNLAEASRTMLHGDAKLTATHHLNVDNSMVIPTGKKVRLLLTSADVIHAWWIPAFGMKKDAIPGFINETWIKTDKVGTYRGQCAEPCSKDYRFMPIVAVVKSPEEFEKWVDGHGASSVAARQ